jgi:Phosphotransferase enzyme family
MDADRVAPQGGYGTAVWSSRSWRTEAVGWLDHRLRSAAEYRIGDVEQPHLRPWATALRAPTSRGTVWLKAPGPGTAFEAQLYPVLDATAGPVVLSPLAVHETRHWILLPDGGPVLGDVPEGRGLVDGLCAAVPRFAQLQLDLTASVDELVVAGVPDMRPEVMPARLDQALESVLPYVERAGSDADRRSYERLVELRAEFDARCRELASYPIRPSLLHGDLHPWNIFAGANGEAPVFFDWGDSTVGHPFGTVLGTLRVVKHLTRTGDDGPEVAKVRDAYLEPFTHLAPRAELVEQLQQACHIGKVARSLSWAAALTGTTPAQAVEYADALFRWLALLLDTSYLGDVDAD